MIPPSQQHVCIFFNAFSIAPQMCELSYCCSPDLPPSNRHFTLSTQPNQSASIFHRLFSLMSYYTHRKADLEQALLHCATSPTCLLISCPSPEFLPGSCTLPVPCPTLSAVCPSYQPRDNAVKRKMNWPFSESLSTLPLINEPFFFPFPLCHAFIPPRTGHIKSPDK